jgi:hypothetical protein
MKRRNGPQSVDFSSLFFWLIGKAIVHMVEVTGKYKISMSNIQVRKEELVHECLE